MKTTKKYGQKIDDALSLWVKLTRAYLTMSKRVSENVKSFNLTEPQFGALECMGHLGPMTIGHLCNKQLVSGGNMTLVIDNLEKEGLAERIHSKEDRRTIVVQLTPKGRELFDKIFVRHAEFVAELTSVLSKDEITQLSNLLKKLGTGIE
ncbi:MAG: MarR family transcriptional regulator [Ignavibacteriales bacterium]|jgi:MarR family 2-MHQ and catechol resistance regulon transcriptional repressor|nr:MarR family transcriptional regulator [Ignavibacteriaceae bacterium]NLH62312.1 MarR family transcriptional regulator [Ignavibacteriales bacterium]HOJ18570.1 MarR family transcriptional regulator [Ignavibacteriaceae bacterium]HPO55475.1 MarR family transcriptional regulator [Ignavibacteriaceae bacterium]